MSCLYTHSIKVVDNPDFTVVILQVILDVVVFHVRANIFLHALTVFFLEVIRVLQHNIRNNSFYTQRSSLGVYLSH